ncbi:hypothetical protein A5782_21730 [Mycobacterium sp. 852002-40037_SCH5390672]|nr:hypothetical protein A5782_21730 [Mycobacterium sp. 852002-40037_SCH5390672]
MFAPYNKRSRLLPGGFFEVMSPAALRKSLADGLDIVCRLEHDPRYLLATTESRTLEINDDPNVGASYRALLPNTMAGRDAWELVRTNRLNHSSAGFMCLPGGDEWRREGATLVRYLKSVRLVEASPVSQPGYIETSTAVRSLAGQLGEDPDEVLALAQNGELRSLFMRTDEMVSATPGIEPAFVETRNQSEPQSDTALVTAMQANRARRYPSRRQPHGDELGQLVACNRANRYPRSTSDDGRAFYARVRNELEQNAS